MTKTKTKTNDMNNTTLPSPKRLHKKGVTESPRLVLDAVQKYKVYQWVEKNKEMCEKKSAEELAQTASKDIGFSISSTSILTFRNAVYPDLKRVRSSVKTDHSAQLSARVDALESRMNDMDAYCNYLCEEMNKLESTIKAKP